MSINNMYTATMGFVGLIYFIEQYIKKSYPNKKAFFSFLELTAFLVVLYFLTDTLFSIALNFLSYV